MIVRHGYIGAMNENDEPCLELNEIIYHITGEFWKQAYYGLLAKQKTYKTESDISAHQAVCELRKGGERHAEVTRLPFPYFAAVTCRQSAPDHLTRER